MSWPHSGVISSPSKLTESEYCTWIQCYMLILSPPPRVSWTSSIFCFFFLVPFLHVVYKRRYIYEKTWTEEEEEEKEKYSKAFFFLSFSIPRFSLSLFFLLPFRNPPEKFQWFYLCLKNLGCDTARLLPRWPHLWAFKVYSDFFCPKQRNSHDFQWRHILFQSRWIHCDSICRLQWNLAFAPCCLVRAFLRLYFTLKHQISCICGSLVGYSAFLSFFIEFVKHNCSDNLLTVRNKYFAEPAWRQGFDKRVGPISIFLSISSLHSFGFQESFLKERGREMIVSFLEEDAFFLL